MGISQVPLDDLRTRSARPPRRRGSIRRTTSLDIIWAPDASGVALDGRGRDLVTLGDGSTVEVARGTVAYDLSPVPYEILSATVDHRPTPALVGTRLGGGYRRTLPDLFPDDVAEESVTYSLLDDAGAAFVAMPGLTRWPSTLPIYLEMTAGRFPPANTCMGFQEGGAAFDSRYGPERKADKPVLAPPDPDDPIGWHEVGPSAQPMHRRSRTLDVWEDGDVVKAEEWFQDAATLPSGAWHGVHEYTVAITVSAVDSTITEATVTAHVLPWAECMAVIPNGQRVVGLDVLDLRASAARVLPGVEGCTHLNDTLRSLSAVSGLVAKLDALSR